MSDTSYIKQINILLCDTFPDRLPDFIPSYEYMFEKLFHSVDENLPLKTFRALEGELPKQLKRDELYVITGSLSDAYDTLPWILNLQEWVRKAASQRVPLTGICFGHQLIALALGGHVERFSGGWGVGIRESDVVNDEMLPYFPDHRLRLIYNHFDQVLRLPEGATATVTSEFCRYEGFRIGNHIITFQGHPEFSVEYERHVILNHAENEDKAIKEHALHTLDTIQPQGKIVAEFLLNFFKK
ncbi:MAG: type 1 glutamine amidotransferase [Bacteroidales bacterium]|nr:type 1 glutamine amidotransferase [Bacteroidales bacterium]